jgi:hypothetical protein
MSRSESFRSRHPKAVVVVPEFCQCVHTPGQFEAALVRMSSARSRDSNPNSLDRNVSQILLEVVE